MVEGEPTTDGAGVHLLRALGTRALPMLDPFLMLDEFRSNEPSDYLAGFPTHPHRGFETVTYMLAGAMEHRDSLGNRGRLVAGSTQWMTAGHGIVHSEMPKQVSGLMHGYQLWVNLPRAHKMIPPRYQDIAPERFSTLEVDDARVRLVAGEIGTHRGPVEGIVTAPHMLDVTIPRRGSLQQTLPSSHNAFAYVIEGEVLFGDDLVPVARQSLAVFSRSLDQVAVRARSEAGARFLMFAGRPINEPVARRGPFVMNTEDELRQAYSDYQSGALTRL